MKFSITGNHALSTTRAVFRPLVRVSLTGNHLRQRHADLVDRGLEGGGREVDDNGRSGAGIVRAQVGDGVSIQNRVANLEIVGPDCKRLHDILLVFGGLLMLAGAARDGKAVLA
jgi:hypothetical protein